MLCPCCEPLHHVREMCSDFRRNRRFLGNQRDVTESATYGRVAEAVKMFFHAQEHILCSTWWLVNDLKIDLQMGRFGFGLADLPPDLKIGGVANRFANHFCDFLFANGRFVRTNSTFSVQICQYLFLAIVKTI